MTPDMATRYVSRLERLAGIGSDSSIDRTAMAALRRSLSVWPSVPAEAIRVVAPFLPDQATGWREALYYLIGGLFALHPCDAKSADRYGKSFGGALAQAARLDPTEGAERRLLALLGTKSEDLPIHLRHSVAYLQARGIEIDYRRLMLDLSWWDSPNGDVQRRWGRDFWRTAGSEDRSSDENVSEKEEADVH